jgi:transposase InsO family protein
MQLNNQIILDDNFYDQCIQYLNNKTIPINQSINGKNIFIKKCRLFTLENGKLFTKISSKTLNVLNNKVELIPPRRRDEVLQLLYNDLRTTANSRDKFYSKVALNYLNISRRYVQDWLKKQVDYQLHYYQPREKSVKPSSEDGINQKMQIDLIDLSNIGGFNARRNWVLTAIDVFTKYAFARTITTKTAVNVSIALEEILIENYNKTGAYPKVIHSDNGKEFINKDMKALFESHKIRAVYGPTYNPQAQGTIEKFNKTLKGLIFSYISKRQTQKVQYASRYYDVLDKIVDNYNTTIHSTIKSTPISIHKTNRVNLKQKKLVQKHLEEFASNSKELAILQNGDKVRVHILNDPEQRKQQLFAKKYVIQWSRSIYQVVKRFNVTNTLKRKQFQLRMIQDEDGNVANELIKKKFYRKDLQLII